MNIGQIIAWETFGLGMSVASATLASKVLDESIGVRGGAVYGTFSYLLGRPVGVMIQTLTGANEEGAPKIAKLAAAVGSFAAGSACAWACTNAALGTSDDFVYTDGLAMAGVSGGFCAAAVLAAVCCAFPVLSRSRSEVVTTPASIV